MFSYDIAHWTFFLSAAILLNIAPGPDMAFIMGHTVKGGVRGGTAAMLGIWTGAMGHVLLAALGLSAIIATTALAFAAVKWAGVIYLLWMGIQALRSNGESFLLNGAKSGVGFWRVYRQGVFIDLLNPKVALFFLAFLPQFVVEGSGPVWAQLLLHGTLIIVVAAFIEPPLILLGDRITTKLRNSRTFSKWMDRTLGALLVGLGIRLAFTERG